MATLRRRQQHLVGILEKSTEPLSYIEAEESALRFAIEWIAGDEVSGNEGEER